MVGGSDSTGGPAVAMSGATPPSRNRFALRSPKEALQPVAPPAPPPKRRRRAGFLGRLSGIMSLLVVAAIVFGSLGLYAKTEIEATGPLAADKIVVIPKLSSGEDIVEQLTNEGVVDRPTMMTLAIMVTRPHLRAGEYLFKKEASVSDVLRTIESGKVIIHKLTIPEGLTSDQIIDRLNEDDTLAGDIKETPREGSLLPETYTFERGQTREQTLKTMRIAQERLVKDVWSRRAADLPLRTPAELVTLASIVEKETGKSDERARIAGVFINRLNRDMRLQTDPTVIYGIIGGKGPFGRGLTRSELDTPTPYNTYLIKGLPPGPIANPGKAALEAAANPMKTRELYFVADGTGGHAFAETIEQHNKNVARWRQLEPKLRENQIPPVQPSNGALPALNMFGPYLPGTAPQQPLAQPAPTPAPGFAPAPTINAPATNAPGTTAPGLKSELMMPRTLLFATGKLPTSNSPFALAPLPDFSSAGIPDLDASADGASPASGPVNTAGMTDDQGSDQVQSYPVPAYRRTGIKTTSPGAARPPESQDGSAGTALAYQPENRPANSRPRAFDAVEGTDKDPLRNTTYDLNSAKTIPNFR
jgi:UPF0755 protein